MSFTDCDGFSLCFYCKKCPVNGDQINYVRLSAILSLYMTFKKPVIKNSCRS